jgi:hypothetical protein
MHSQLYGKCTAAALAAVFGFVLAPGICLGQASTLNRSVAISHRTDAAHPGRRQADENSLGRRIVGLAPWLFNLTIDPKEQMPVGHRRNAWLATVVGTLKAHGATFKKYPPKDIGLGQ